MKVGLALLSVHDKTGLVEFARALRTFGVEILSTGGTAAALRQAGIPHREVSDLTGSPEILDGRVKTLHPRVHGGILAVRSRADHLGQLEKLGGRPIDLVCVNLYPFEEAAARPGARADEVIEQIDIGGPALVRSAAKNSAFVAVVVDPADYPGVIEEMLRRDGSVGDEMRRALAVKAFALTARYDGAIAAWFDGAGPLPGVLTLQVRKRQDLRYGENPHQEAACYQSPSRTGASVAFARFLGGKELSFNNLIDLEAAFELVREFHGPAAVVVKHANPCGAAVAGSAGEAFSGAMAGDPVSAYGGVVAFNVPVDEDLADRMAAAGNFLEAVAAPGFSDAAQRLLRERPKWGRNVRLLETGPIGPDAPNRLAVRGIRDGLLVQTPDRELYREWTVVTGRLDDARRADLEFAWIVCKHVASNAVVIAKDRRVVGVGAGQMSRVDAAELAVRKAEARASGSVAASDAFFPFPDALLVLAKAGVTAVAHPGGSIRDKEVIEAARKANVTLVVTGTRHFRH